MIRAECHSADNERVVQFDSTPWFEEADADTIVLLAGRDWTAPWVADALERRPHYQELRELLQYARDKLQGESVEDPNWSTFSCRVNGSDALSWLELHRPLVAQRIRKGG
jgi:hypothetical protein